MGTPDFAVEALHQLVENGFNVVGVITNVDKPAGRGRKMVESAVKKYAVEKGLCLMQPKNLKSTEFIEDLQQLHPDLGIVVAFRMLPEVVWNMPRFGTFNLHASLLPQYRGAAPINWAIMNGDKETGNSTFFLQHEIDTGKIIFREPTEILEDETAGSLHDKLMVQGGKLVVKTVEAIVAGDYPQVDQTEIVGEGEELRSAPKIFKEDCKIDWSRNLNDIYNHVRGLSPYPAAWSEITDTEGKTISMKIYQADKEPVNHDHKAGEICSDSKTFLKVAALGGFLNIQELQQAGKKRMVAGDFLRGFQGDIGTWRFQI